MLGILFRQDARPPQKAVFGGYIGRFQWRCLVRMNRPNIDDNFPRLPRYICRSAAREVRKAPSRWMASIFFQSEKNSASNSFFCACWDPMRMDANFGAIDSRGGLSAGSTRAPSGTCPRAPRVIFRTAKWAKHEGRAAAGWRRRLCGRGVHRTGRTGARKVQQCNRWRAIATRCAWQRSRAMAVRRPNGTRDRLFSSGKS